MTKILPIIVAVLVGLLAGGCADISPGKLSNIQTASVQSHVGNVYLFRGFIGIFSTGMNQLDEELKAEGVQSFVFQSDQWTAVADTIETRYKSKADAEPIVLVGHSFGADNILRIAQRLKDKGVKIDLLVTLDPVTPPKVPADVKQVVNLYQTNGAMDALPWLRGIPLEAEKPNTVALANVDLRKERTDLVDSDLNHFNIEKKAKIHAEVIRVIKDVCVDRGAWLAMRRTPTQLAAMHAAAPTTMPAQARVE